MTTHARDNLRSASLDEYLARREADGYKVETRTAVQAVIVRRRRLFTIRRFVRTDEADRRLVVSVDGHGESLVPPQSRFGGDERSCQLGRWERRSSATSVLGGFGSSGCKRDLVRRRSTFEQDAYGLRPVGLRCVRRSLAASDRGPVERCAVPRGVTGFDVGAAIEQELDRVGAAGVGGSVKCGCAAVAPCLEWMPRSSMSVTAVMLPLSAARTNADCSSGSIRSSNPGSSSSRRCAS